MTTEGQDALVAEMERFARLAERLAAEIRRLTAGINSDLAVCLSYAEEIEADCRAGTALARDDGSD